MQGEIPGTKLLQVRHLIFDMRPLIAATSDGVNASRFARDLAARLSGHDRLKRLDVELIVECPRSLP
jgi:hypothetical protein